MFTVSIALLLRPFVALFVLGLVCLPARMAVKRWVPEGRLKSVLLSPVGSKESRGCNRR